MNFPTTFAEATQPLPNDELAAKRYEVHLGLTRAYAEAIIAMALEPAIREYCPNDSASRFANLAATEQWLSKGRAVFLLLKRTDDGLQLAGYGWVGDGTSSHVPGGQTTFAIRIGEAGQGQGLATPYMRAILTAAVTIYGAQKLWLETWQSNGAAVHVYHKLGFVDVDQEPGERPTASGGTVADTRLYMQLYN